MHYRTPFLLCAALLALPVQAQNAADFLLTRSTKTKDVGALAA